MTVGKDYKCLDKLEGFVKAFFLQFKWLFRATLVLCVPFRENIFEANVRDKVWKERLVFIMVKRNYIE